MTSRSTPQLGPQFFSFRVESLPDYLLAVSVSEVEIITDAIQISRIPIMPPTVYGIGYWEGNIITVLDLAAALRGGAAPVAASLPPNQRIMIAKVPIQGLQYVSWPIEGSARIVELSDPIYQEPAPSSLDSRLIEESLRLEDNKMLILRLIGLFSLE